MTMQLTDRARKAAEEIRKQHCEPFKTWTREEHRQLTKGRTSSITPIIERHMREVNITIVQEYQEGAK